MDHYDGRGYTCIADSGGFHPLLILVGAVALDVTGLAALVACGGRARC